jgi:UDP-MurNAc hydroxylase
VIACADRQELPLPGGGSLKLFMMESGTNRDSGLLVRADGQGFLNINDCKIHDRVAGIAGEEGPIDVFTAQFSGAIWHPVCYEYPHAHYEAISRQKRDSKFEAVARSIETLRPRAYLASAGPACFLDPELFHLNLEKAGIFPRAPMLFDFLHRRLPGASTRYLEPMPGDVLDVTSLEVIPAASERITDGNLEAYLRAYAADDPILHGFLGLEVDDLRDFCEGVRTLESRRERTTVKEERGAGLAARSP